jgi:hypothetical protein
MKLKYVMILGGLAVLLGVSALYVMHKRQGRTSQAGAFRVGFLPVT